MKFSMELFCGRPTHEVMLSKMVVYLIRYKGDGKGYIGKTARILRERIKEHIRSNRTYSYVDNAIRKYGAENFEVTILDECLTEEELNAREMFWIKELNTKYPNGFNLTDGGEGTSGYIPSEELRQRWSKINAGRKASEETKRRRSESLMGHPVSQEARDKMSKSHKGKTMSPEACANMSAASAKKRPILCVELDRVFHSMRAAAKWARVVHGTIWKACREPNCTAAGYHWKYAD